MRLDKYLAKLELASRSQVKQYIKAGQIKLNGQVCTKPETQINEVQDKVEFKDVELHYQRFYYYMLNKPKGYVTATHDKTETTVLDLLHVIPKKDLFPVGRLDKDTEGLLLITNDGELAHKLLSPKKHVSKKYYVQLDGKLNEKHIDEFGTGIDIGEKNLTKPAILEISNNEDECYVTITEGKYHQIKRMFKQVGFNVEYLKRISMGNLILDDDLKPGEYRKLTEDEIDRLRSHYAAN